MTLSKVNRFRIILDLVVDGTVTNESDYSGLDKISAVIGTEIADLMWEQYQGTDPAVATNEDKAANAINAIRVLLKDARKVNRVRNAVASAEAAESIAVDAENENDLGTEESLGE